MCRLIVTVASGPRIHPRPSRYITPATHALECDCLLPSIRLQRTHDADHGISRFGPNQGVNAPCHRCMSHPYAHMQSHPCMPRTVPARIRLKPTPTPTLALSPTLRRTHTKDRSSKNMPTNHPVLTVRAPATNDKGHLSNQEITETRQGGMYSMQYFSL
jgi:hypothetical protein